MEETHNGTLFMDEIANFPLKPQSKFIRFLQEGRNSIVQMLIVDHLPGDLKREFEKNPVAIETVPTGRSLNETIASFEKNLF